MAPKRPVNKSGIFLGGPGGTVGPRGEGVGTGDLGKRIAAERAKKAALAVRKAESKPSGFFERMAEDIGLEDFYERDVIPVFGRVFAEAFTNQKETYGLAASSPATLIARTGARVIGKEDEFDEVFDYAADAVRAGAGIVKTKGWEPAKKYVAPAIDKGTKIAGRGIDAFQGAVKQADDEIESAAPQYAVVKSWADRHAVEPVKDAAAAAVGKITNQPVNERILAADDSDRNFLYQSNDITRRGDEQEGTASPQQRERWIQMATGNYGSSAWRGYKSPFSVDQLQRMSDYELVNAAYGTHTSSLASVFEAARNDLKKIGAIPAALNLLSDQITDASKRGDYRGLGNTAEFLARQAASVFMAVNNSAIYAATGGQAGDYRPLVRALKTEPILTSLDALATASLYGKGATIGLKSGGALSKAGAAAARVPGAQAAGTTIAQGARAAAAVPGVGAPLRAAAAVGRGARQIADVGPRVEISPSRVRLEAAAQRRVEKAREEGLPEEDIAEIEETTGGLLDAFDVGARFQLAPSSNFFSKAGALAAKRFLEGDNPFAAKGIDLASRLTASKASAAFRHVAGLTGSREVAPIVNAFEQIFKGDPKVAQRVLYELGSASTIKIGDEAARKVSPGERAAQLESQLEGNAWVLREDGEGVAYRYVAPDPEDTRWRQVVTSKQASEIKREQKLSSDEFNKRYEVLDEEVLANMRAQVKWLRSIDDDVIGADRVARALELLDSEYATVFGAKSGRPGQKVIAPSGTLRELIGQQEARNIRRLGQLGVEGRRGVEEVGVPDVDAAIRAATGIERPMSRLGRREGAGGGLRARLQDPDVAFLTYRVGDEIVAKVISALDEALPRLQEEAATLKRKTQRAQTSRINKIQKDIKKDEDLLAELRGKKSPKVTEQRKAARARLEENRAKLSEPPSRSKELEAAEQAIEQVVLARQNADKIAESLMRDLIENQGEFPLRPFVPTFGGPVGARFDVEAQKALAGRGAPRSMEDVHRGQYALLGNAQDINNFAGSLARNMKMPAVAYTTVNLLTDYLLSTQTAVRFSDDPAKAADELELLREAGRLGGGSEGNVVAFIVDDRTGFLTKKQVDEVNGEDSKAIAAQGVEGVGISDEDWAGIFAEAVEQNAIAKWTDSADKFAGKRVVFVNKRAYDTLLSEARAAAKDPNILRKITQLWVRVTLSTLPRTPIANILGSGLLSVFGGGGFRDFADAYRLIQRGADPMEISNNGLAGLFNSQAPLRIGRTRNPIQQLQRYMDFMYSYNVMGEDLARLAVWVDSVKKNIKDPRVRAQLDDDMRQAVEVNGKYQKLLEAVARGKFADGRDLPPELQRVRDDALRAAEDFLGGSRGLTRVQRGITTAIPFWSWYKHIFKLYFYTLPTKYPGRSLALNTLARLGAQQSAENGIYDSFYEDAIKFGESAEGRNVYANIFSTNIFPFTFGETLSGIEFDERDKSVPGVQFAAGLIAPTYTLPLRAAGVGIPGLPLIGPEGGDVGFSEPGYGEAVASEAERLIAPIGLIQRAVSPRTSLFANIYRGLTGGDVPTQQPFGKGEEYAVTPRGFAGLGVQQALEDAALRAFGVTRERIPVRGPVAERRLRDRERRARQTALDRYREQREQERERQRENR